MTGLMEAPTPAVEPVVVEAKKSVPKLTPKVILATVFPFLGALVFVIINFIFSGEIDAKELQAIAAGAATSLLALLGGWLGRPGEVVVDVADVRRAQEAPSV